MKVTAWNNGQHSKTGAGYGVKLSAEDRDREFCRSWSTVTVALEGEGSIQVNVEKKSFWNESCRELIPPILESGLGHTDWLRGPRVSHLNCTSSLAVRLNSDFVSDHESLKFSPAEAPPDALAVGTMDLGASFGQCHLPNQLSSVRLRWLPPDLLMQTAWLNRSGLTADAAGSCGYSSAGSLV